MKKIAVVQPALPGPGAKHQSSTGENFKNSTRKSLKNTRPPLVVQAERKYPVLKARNFWVFSIFTLNSAVPLLLAMCGPVGFWFYVLLVRQKKHLKKAAFAVMRLGQRCWPISIRQFWQCLFMRQLWHKPSSTPTPICPCLFWCYYRQPTF